MNFQNTLIRASSVGLLMTEPVSKAEKEAGSLSKTAKSHLVDVYVNAKYGRTKDVQTKQMRKGNEVEEEAIQFLGEYLNNSFSKNEERFTNDFIAGTPDILKLKDGSVTIYDVKSSYDLFTFTNKIPDKLDNIYFAQMQSYMWLTGADMAYVAFCLLNTPFGIMEQEKKSLLYKMNVISEESPEYVKEAMKMEFNMTFDDIPMNERILLFPVHRDDEYISKVEDKVLKARIFLEELEVTHLNFNNK